MPPEQLAALVSVPAAVAVIVMAGMFLKHISNEREKDRVAAAERDKQNRLVFENHLSQSIAVQSQTAGILGELVTAVKVMQVENKSSLDWAKEAMAGLVRELGRSQPAKE